MGYRYTHVLHTPIMSAKLAIAIAQKEVTLDEVKFVALTLISRAEEIGKSKNTQTDPWFLLSSEKEEGVAPWSLYAYA